MANAETNDGRIFVFGSNLAGRHGKGAALFAKQNRGAISGKGVGHHGQSYAIPTKSSALLTLGRNVIKIYVEEFMDYARANPELRFEVTKIGCGLAGYDEREIAPLFRGAPENCDLPEGWR